MLKDKELEALIQGGESDSVEFKASARDLDKLRETICAFANDLSGNQKSGVLFVGLDNDGSCAGMNIDDKLLTKLGGLNKDGKILPFPTMFVEKRTLNDCNVVVIRVEPSDNPPVRMNNRCWVRNGPRQSQATPEEERRLTEKSQWRQIPYDMNGVIESSAEEDLNLEKLREEYLPAVVPQEVLSENQRNEMEQMQALRLLTRDGVPTVTAILMLGKDPQYWFPGAYIQFVRFAGEKVTSSVLNQTKLIGTLPEQLREMDRILKANRTVALDTRGTTHTEQPDYPYEALRELVRNAVVHRTYGGPDNTGSTTPVRVYWYADKVEISSPGSVYGEVTRENFGQGLTDYRNPTITEALKNMGFVQKFGMGIVTARELCEKNGNRIDFEPGDTFINVTVGKRQQ